MLSNGSLQSSTYSNGSSVSYSYDSYDRPIAMQWAGFNPSTVTYDARGNVYKATDGLTGVTVTYEYDLIGRPLSATSTDGFKVWTAYDDINRVAQSCYRLPGGSVTKTSYHYGDIALGQIPSALYGLSINGTERVAYTYDSFGRTTSRSVASGLSYTTSYRYLVNPNGTTTTLIAGITNVLIILKGSQ